MAGGLALGLARALMVGLQSVLQPGLWAPPPQGHPQRQQEAYVDASQPVPPDPTRREVGLRGPEVRVWNLD